ncbi:calcium-binding protein [Pseudomonas tohonis]|nr:calcium-binding protein [Pseudomonas tohonis]
MSGNLNIADNGNGTLSVTSEGKDSSATISIGTDGKAKISGDIGILGISYDPTTGEYSEKVNVPVGGGIAKFSFGNKGKIDADMNVVYDAMFIGLSGKTIGGTELSGEFTVGVGIDEDGNRAFKLSGEASISFFGGLISFSGELEEFYWDPADMFDPEEDGALSSGLAGNAFSALKNRHAQIDAAVNGTDAGSQISVATNQHFNEANAFVERRDPLSLDLDGDGIETVGANAGITFDFDGDGLKTGTGWVKGDDGFLVLDRNSNGQIDNGGELFGVDTVKANGQKASNGFDALKDFDSNGDGVFDAQDTQFANVKIWQDANQDGIAQAGELKTLAEHNIVAINLDSTASNHNSNGNLISAVGSFVRGDGSEGTVNANQSLAANLDLASNPFYREFTDHIALDDTAKALPDMKGSGAVRDLREASMLNAELKTLLATYSQAQTREEQMGLLDQLIAEWAKSADYKTFDERINALDDGTTDVRFQYSWEANGTQPTEAQQNTQKLLERVKALEVFNAQNILKFGKVGSGTNSLTLSFGVGTASSNSSYNTTQGSVVIDENRLGFNAGQIGLLNQAYESLKLSIYNGLLIQTRLKPYIDAIGLKLTNSGIELDYSETLKLFEKASDTDSLKAATDALEFFSVWKGELPSILSSQLIPTYIDALSHQQVQTLRNSFAAASHILIGSVDSDNISGTAGNDKIFGGAGDDTINGSTGADQLYGGDGNDTLTVNYAYSSGALFVGGKGNDTLIGSAYDDIYVFNLGDGKDVTQDGRGNDVLRFGDGIFAADIALERVGRDLIIRHSNGTDQITIPKFISIIDTIDKDPLIETIQFADGTQWNLLDKLNAGILMRGTEEDDTLTGTSGIDFIYGGAGDDVINGGTGADQLYGGDGNDTLAVNYAYSSGALFVGGKGNDTLIGSAYDDIYVFNLGDGKDVIQDGRGNDVLRFGEGILAADISLERVGRDLIIRHSNGTDQITLPKFISIIDTIDKDPLIETIQFADGTQWNLLDKLNAGILMRGTEEDDTLTGTSGIDFIYGGAGDDVINGGTGADQIYGGDGNDTLAVNYAYSSGALFVGGKGNDTLLGSAYDDTYVFNLGDGQDVIQDGRGNDVLRFGEGIHAADITFERVGRDLIIRHSNGIDQITIPKFISSIDTIEKDPLIETIQFADGTQWNLLSKLNAGILMRGTEEDDTLTGTSGIDFIYGGAGDDVINGGTGADQLYGGDGNDTLAVNYAYSSGALFVGGKGNDTLIGSAYDDTYVFNLGDGKDVIQDGRGNDVLRFGEGILAADVSLERVGRDLIIRHSNGTDQITIPKFISSIDAIENDPLIETIRFADGTQWKLIDKLKAGILTRGTDANDTLIGTSGSDVIYGGAGDDVIDGLTGADQLYGGDGNDTLTVNYAYSSGALFVGGTGNDTLIGSVYGDTYVFNLGDGKDVIQDGYGNDVLRFGEGISANDIWLQRNGSNLELTLRDSTDKVTINNWYSSTSNHIETIKSGDGKTLLDSQVQNLVNAMAAFAPPAGGSSHLTPEQKAQLEVVIAANWA